MIERLFLTASAPEPPPHVMKITLLFFAAARDRSGGRSSQHFELATGSTVSELRQQILTRFPRLEGLLEISRIAVEERFAEETLQLQEGDEVAIIPPVAGG